MRKTEKKEVTSKQEVTIGYKCDCCGKEINATQLPNEWHNFNSHHDEWGNDSIDSYEYYDVCSPKCYRDKMIQIVEGEYKNRKWATIDEKDIQFARLLVETFKSVG
jgi:hypothetical protein